MIIICQAPGELANVLDSYESGSRNGKRVHIICLNVFNLYKFISSLDLNANVYFFENIPIKTQKPLEWIRKKRRLYNNLSLLKGCSFSQLIFCSKFDLQLAFYLKYFRSVAKIEYKRCVDLIAIETEEKDNDLLVRIKCFALSLYTGARLAAIKRGGKKHIVIDVDHYNFTKSSYKLNKEIYPRYMKPFSLVSKRPKIICYAEPFQDNFQTEREYEEIYERILKHIKKCGYDIFIKGHPRKGNLGVAEKYAEHIIPNFIPAEFIDLKDFDFAISMVSTALCTASFKITAYSLMGLYNVTDNRRYDYWIKYLEDCSQGKVIILSSLSEISTLN